MPAGPRCTTPPPEVDGSGIFAIPCVRKHWTNNKAWASAFCCSAGVIVPPFGSRWVHALSADANLAEFVSTLSLLSFPLFVMNSPELVGSGKFSTPCERMQVA